MATNKWASIIVEHDTTNLQAVYLSTTSYDGFMIACAWYLGLARHPNNLLQIPSSMPEH